MADSLAGGDFPLHVWTETKIFLGNNKGTKCNCYEHIPDLHVMLHLENAC